MGDEPMARIRAMPHLDIVAEACDRQLRVLLLSLLLFPQPRLLPLLMLLWLPLPVLPLLVTPAAAPAVAAIVAFVVVGCWTYREDLPICKAPMVGARPQFEDSRQSMRLTVEKK